jgi:hypothetical protein
MNKFSLIINQLNKVQSNSAIDDDYNFVEEVIQNESASYNTFSKLIYDIFLFFIKDIKSCNYSFEAYKSWHIKTKDLELFWDGRDSYLLLWDISTGEKKSLKVESSDLVTFKVIHEYLEIISKN